MPQNKTAPSAGAGPVWTLGEDGVLTISGEGPMADHGAGDPAPWGKELREVRIGEGVTRIGARAFARCGALRAVTVPASVTRIGEDAFWGCPALILNVTRGSRAERYCRDHGLRYILTDETASGVCGAAGGELRWTLDAGRLTVSGSGAMADYELDSEEIYDLYYETVSSAPWGKRIREVRIGEGVTSIGEAAFAGCDAIETAELPASVTRIGDWAFCECRALRAVRLPAGVTEIGANAFADCDALTLVVTRDSYAARYGEENGLNCAYTDAPDRLAD